MAEAIARAATTGPRLIAAIATAALFNDAMMICSVTRAERAQNPQRRWPFPGELFFARKLCFGRDGPSHDEFAFYVFIVLCFTQTLQRRNCSCCSPPLLERGFFSRLATKPASEEASYKFGLTTDNVQS